MSDRKRSETQWGAARTRRRSLTQLEVLALLVVFVIAVSLWFGLTRGRFSPHELSPRLVCASNLKGIGTSCKIYANESDGSWPIPAFDEGYIGNIDYRVQVGGGAGSVRSPSRSQPSQSRTGGATQLSVTRALWTFVRSGDVTVKQFICLASGDTEDGTEYLDHYYDFTSYRNLSYGYQVPFGPAATRPRDGLDNRMVLAADKGPYVDGSVSSPPPGLKPIAPLGPGYATTPPGAWAQYNSPNHPGEGQNVLYADGHVEFRRVPTVGVDGDNIYTVALDNYNESSRVAGESPWMRSQPPFFPFIFDAPRLSSTDSVIFP